MDETRHGYVILPGAQGLETKVGRPSPLFGSDEVDPLVVADPTMTRGHFVVFPKAFGAGVSEEEKAAFLSKARTLDQMQTQAHNEAVVVGRVTRNRDPQRAVEYREGRIVVPSYLGDDSDVASAQARFYTASDALREQFVLFSTETLHGVEAHLRQMATLVTIADTTIHARPLTPRDGMDRYEDRGFEVVAEFRQFVVLGMPRAEVAEFRIYSETGEYPVHVPQDVEMGMLLRMNSLVTDLTVKHDMTRQERAARLINMLKGV